MGKGRDIIFYALAYLLGDVLWQVLLSSSGIAGIIILAVLLAAASCFCIVSLGGGRAAGAVGTVCLLG
ncbi:MAG: hypothetical protein J6T58_06605, partial [Bacteroidales bacterium]|nr:hypothetical protein [Bacteroidales bacterium]